MTIQNWALRPDAALIVCDTLVTHMETNRPLAFASKAWCVPHRSLMIASLMWAYPAMTLFSNLSLGLGPDEIGDLPAYATEVLLAAARSQPEVFEAWGRPTEVGIFAWDAAANEIVGWRFFGREDFAFEQMAPDGGIFIRPMPEGNVAGMDWYDVGVQQQVEDREIDAFDRDNLGGSMVKYEMVVSRSGRPPTITITNYGHLPHFGEQAAAVEQAMNETHASPFMIMQNS